MDSPNIESLSADILIVDDRPNNLKLLSKILASYKYKVRCATSGMMALQVIKEKAPDLILLDISMPEMDGYQVCEEVMKDFLMSQIPIIFISALDGTFDKVKAFQVGGRDYITKPFEVAEVLARIQNQLELKYTQEKLHYLNQKLENINDELEQKVENRTIQLRAEIRERCQAQEKLLKMAMQDSLTNLANRNYLIERLQTCLNIVHQRPTEKFALLFLGCDRFKMINDSLGHVAGDRLLIAIAQRLKTLLPEGNLLARLGGDEFTVILETANSVEEAVAIAKKLQQAFVNPTIVENREFFINFSIGIVLGTKEYQTPEQLLRDADIALHCAKKCGMSSYKVFNALMHRQAITSLQLETDLRLAVQRQEFVLHYQPIVSLKSDRIVGAEALIRWLHPQKGLIPPARFIPTAEETNIIIPMGMWIIREACLQLARWQQQTANSYLNSLEIEINLSVRQLAQPNLVELIEQMFQKAGIQKQKLKLEITESIFMGGVEESQLTLNKIRNCGLQLVLDDFGTGYSSLEYLQKLPISTLKIDRSFICNLKENIHNHKIVKATIDLAHTLGLDVIAEGVETSEQLTVLRNLGCDYGQGYLFSKPLEMPALEELVRVYNSRNIMEEV